MLTWGGTLRRPRGKEQITVLVGRLCLRGMDVRLGDGTAGGEGIDDRQ